MLSTIGKINHSPAFCATKRILVADSNIDVLGLVKDILTYKNICSEWDTLEITGSNSYTNASYFLNSGKKYDAAVIGDLYKKEPYLGEDTSKNKGLQLAEEAVNNNKLGKNEIVLFSEDDIPATLAKNEGFTVLRKFKDRTHIAPKVKEILSGESGTKFESWF